MEINRVSGNDGVTHFLGFGIWITAMIDIPCNVSSFCRIDVGVGIECHHIVVRVFWILSVSVGPLSELVVVDDLSDVFDEERAPKHQRLNILENKTNSVIDSSARRPSPFIVVSKTSSFAYSF